MIPIGDTTQRLLAIVGSRYHFQYWRREDHGTRTQRSESFSLSDEIKADIVESTAPDEEKGEVLRNTLFPNYFLPVTHLYTGQSQLS